MRHYRGNGLRVVYDVVRDPGPGACSGATMREPADVARAVAQLQANGLAPAEREFFGVIALDTKHRPIGIHAVSIGTLNSCPVHPREVFRFAIAAGAASIVAVHNHPSGDPTPSPDDERVTERLRSAGELIGIELLDHVICAGERWHSFADPTRRVDR